MQILLYKNMRAEDGHFPFYFSQLLFFYSFNINTTAVSEPVVHLIRKNYIHMSWGGGHNRGLPCIILPPKREQIQQLCNIITIFYIATTSQRRRDEAWETFPEGGSSKSRDAEERSVVCQTCQGGYFQSKEMSWASVLLSTAWGACCCCWGGSCCCCCGPPGGATL